MKVVWTEESLIQIEIILEYISSDDPIAADSMSDHIFTTVESILPDNPQLGRPGRVEGTRELVIHASYIVAYQINGNDIEILAVLHTSLHWPKGF